MAAAKPDLSLIPPVLRGIARELGLAAAIDVARKIGGTRIAVPKSAGQATALVELIGMAAAQVLVGQFGGENLQVPRAVRALAALRAQLIQADTRSNNQVARAYGLTSRRVATIRNSPAVGLVLDRRRDDRQLDLIELIEPARSGSS